MGQVFHIISTCRELFIPFDGISFIETRHGDRKPTGWCDYHEAVITLKNSIEPIGLNKEEWSKLRNHLDAVVECKEANA